MYLISASADLAKWGGILADPFLKFYTSDWRSDPRLRMCSPAARGMWIEMICLMHEASPYGHLLIHGQTPNEGQLASLTGIPSAELPHLMAELERHGVYSRTKEGVIYSRKLVRMASKSAKSRRNGKLGGNPTLRKDTVISGSVNLQDNGDDKPQKPEARSQKKESSSSSSSADAPARDPPTENPQPVPQPVEWSLPEDAYRLYDSVMAAVGLANAIRIPTYWMPPTAVIEVCRWRGLGLTDDEIVEVAKGSRKHHTGPPDGPMALNRAMKSFAAAKTAPRLTPPEPAMRTPGATNVSRLDTARTHESERLGRILRAAAAGTTGPP